MKRILRIGMLLCSFLLASVGWVVAQEGSKLTIEGNDVYANGYPVTITAAETAGKIIIAIPSNNPENTEPIESIEIDGEPTTLYGGSKEAPVSSTSITMYSGTIRNIFGGGYSQDKNKPADVNGDISIALWGGTVSNLLVGGGRYYSKTTGTKGISIVVYNDAVTLKDVICGAFDAGETTNTLNTTLEESVNGVKYTEFLMRNGGKITGYLFVGGGQGYAFSDRALAIVEGVTINKGVLGTGSNGRSNTVDITLNKCKFEKAQGQNAVIEIAPLNRGIVGTATMIFKGCTFPANPADYYCYAGATYKYDGTSTVQLSDVRMTFGETEDGQACVNVPTVAISKGLDEANVTISGAPVALSATSAASENDIKAYSIAADKTWAFNNGLTIADDVTLTNNGTLNVANVNDVNNLYGIFEAGANMIVLNNQTYTLSKQLVIKKPMTLFGNFATFEADPNVNWPTKKNSEGQDVIDNAKANLISIEAGKDAEVTLMNINLKNSKAAGINVQTAKKVTMTNVSSENNATAGLLVHAPVEVSSFRTSGNKWGGVNIDKGKNGADTYDYNPSFTFNESCSFAESNQIWSELAEKEATEIVTLPESNTTWRAIKGKSDDGEKNMWFWTNQKMTQETIGGITYVYANGNPVTVSASTEEEGKTTITSDNQTFTFENTATVYLFGGSKDASVENTSITMTGGKLTQIYGGGYGSSTNADVTSTTGNGIASIYITGGEIERIIGGGRFKATTEQVDLTIEGENTKIYRIYAGGWSNSATRAERWNEAETRTGIVNINIQDATIMNAFGCGGGFGYTYTGRSFVRIFNAVLGDFKGTYANGYADEIDAEINNCTFKPFFWKGSESAYYELGTTNRGVVNNAAFTFNDCKFESTSDEVTTSQPMNVCIGVVEGWGDSDTNGEPVPEVKGSVSYTFVNCKNTPQVVIGEGMDNANVTLSGASAILRKYHRGEKITVGEKEKNSFAINAGKTWTFNNGLTFATEEDQQATLTNHGMLIVKGVDSEADLQAAVAMGADTIKLAAKDFALTKQLTINKSVALVGTTDGGKTSTIKYSDTFKGGTDSNSKHMISVLASKVLLQNLVVDGTGHNTDKQANSGSAINVYTATGVVLDNVVAKNTIAAGLIVNGSEVTATNFHTENNGWYGVNVDKGSGVTATPKFTIGNNCSFAETTAIKADSQDAASSWVVGDGWVMVTEDDKTYKIWQNAAAQGINYAIISVPATVVYGEANLPLLSNITPVGNKQIKFDVTAGSESVEIETVEGKQTLKIKKPGLATLSLEYDGVTVTQAVEVLKRTITVSGITAENKTYDGTTNVTLITNNVTPKGAVAGDNLTFSYSGSLTSAGAGDAVPVEITVAASGMAEGKAFGEYYTVAVAPVTAKVSKAELTVKTKTITAIDYNGTMPPFDAEYSGFVNNETKDVLSGTLQFDCPATSTSLAGTYKVTPYGLTSNNYAIKYEGADLTINAVEPTVEIVSATVSNDKSTVTVKGHVTNNGGTKTTELKGGFQVGETEKASGLTVDENGYFTADLTDLSKAEINLKATATATIPESQSLKGTSTTDFKVDLALNPQNVSFVTNLSRLVYGSKVTLDAAGYAEGATVTYSVEGKALKLDKTDGKTITAAETGTATITVTAKLEGYITATAKQTVVVEPKSVTINPFKNTLTKAYDGELEIPVEYSLVGLLKSDQAVMPNNDNVKFMFLDKNVGTNKPIVTTGPLKLRGTNAEYYTMVQPTNLTGTITPGDKVTVEVSNVHRKYNESALHYSLNFTANGKRIDPIYTGSITVTENRSNGTWTASLNSVKFPNYGEVSLASKEGPVNIEKGTPKVLTYTSAANTVSGLLVDAEGWTTSVIEIKNDGVKQYAQVTYDGKIARGVSLSPVRSLQDHNWQINEDTQTAQLLSARMLRAGSDAEQITFGQKKVLTRVMDFTYSVSNPAVVTLTEKDRDSYYINAVGVGDAAVIATHSGGTVVYKQIHVNPATLTITASNKDKTYDGTTVANPSLTIKEAPAGVALDLTGISFNYTQANAGTMAINPTQPIALTGANAANYQVSMSDMTGKINARELTVTSPISKYYDGSATLTLTDYNATGLLVGEAAPAITVTFADANVGTDKRLTTSLANSNYSLALGNPTTGNIVRSTIDAVLPESAPSKEALKQRVALTVRETGATVTYNTIDYNPTITTTGSGTTLTYYISGGDTENYAVVYSSNQLGYGADPVTPGGGGGTVTPEPEIPTVSNPVVAERTATTAAITWEKVSGATSYKLFLYAKKTDSTPLKTYEFDKDGKLKATTISFTLTGLEEGKSYYIETAAYNALGTLLVKKSVELSATPTGIEAISEGSQLYTVRGAIVVAPAEPLRVAIYSVTGQTLFNDEVSYLTQVPAKAGIYVVVIQKGNDRITEKVFVK